MKAGECRKQMPSSSNPESSDLPFEEAMERLEEIVESMESDTLSLAEMLKNYEEGSGLLKSCQRMIAQAQSRIELINMDDSGAAKVESFNSSGGADPKPETSPKGKLAELDLSEEGEEIRLF